MRCARSIVGKLAPRSTSLQNCWETSARVAASFWLNARKRRALSSLVSVGLVRGTDGIYRRSGLIATVI